MSQDMTLIIVAHMGLYAGLESISWLILGMSINVFVHNLESSNQVIMGSLLTTR